jgi:hypothetical protein
MILKLPQFILELLQKEVRSTSEQVSIGNCNQRKEYGESVTDDWRPVKVSQVTKKTVNLPLITDYCIQTADHYTVLNNSQEPSNHLPKFVSPTSNTISGKKAKKSLGIKKHTVLLIGDSHARGITEKLVSHLGSFYQSTGNVKPNADLNIITSTASSAVKKSK